MQESKVKQATIEDAEIVLKLVKKFAVNSPYSSYVSGDKLKELTYGFLRTPDRYCIFLYEDHSFIAGAITEFLLGHDLIATEMGWWVDPAKRDRKIGKELLGTFEEWVKGKGVHLISLQCLDDSVGSYYEKRGYTLYERAYMKEI